MATERAPQAVLCLDAFHVVTWASAALDVVRRGIWNQLRREGKTDQATALKQPVGAAEKSTESRQRPTQHRGYDREDQPSALPRLRLLTRRAYGYHSAEALIAMTDLTRGGLCPPLPEIMNTHPRKQQ